MSGTKKFGIVIDGKVFESNEEGMLDLNDIWRGCELESKKRPNQWRNALSKSFAETGNLQSGEKQSVVGEVPTNLITKTIYADEEATIGYAMFVSVDFYRLVLEAFVALRNGEIAKAYDLAQSTKNTSAETAFDKWMSYADTPLRDACGMLGVKRTMLFMKESKKPAQLESFIKRDILKYRNYGDKGSSIRITANGKKWLKGNIDTVNEKLEAMYNKVDF